MVLGELHKYENQTPTINLEGEPSNLSTSM